MGNIVSLPTSPELTDISKQIAETWTRHRAAVEEAQAAAFDLGDQFLKARKLLASDNAFGDWCDKQAWADDISKDIRWGAMNLANNRDIALRLLRAACSERTSPRQLWLQVRELAAATNTTLRELREDDPVSHPCETNLPRSIPEQNVPTGPLAAPEPDIAAAEPQKSSPIEPGPRASALTPKVTTRHGLAALHPQQANILLDFYTNPVTRTVVGKIAKCPSQRTNMYTLISLIQGGKLGEHNTRRLESDNLPCARLLFGNIPLSVANLVRFKPGDQKRFGAILGNVDRYAALSKQVEQWEAAGIPNNDIHSRALHWWQTPVVVSTHSHLDPSVAKDEVEKPAPATAVVIPQVSAVPDMSFLRPTTLEWIELVPLEAPITVYGKPIWPMPTNGRYPSLSFMQVWAMVQIWQDLDRLMIGEARHQADPETWKEAKGRGRHLLNMSRQFGWLTNSREIADLWRDITTAQMAHPELEAETLIPGQRPNVA